ATIPDDYHCQWVPIPSFWDGADNPIRWYLESARPAAPVETALAWLLGVAASRLHSSHAHSRRSDRPPWSRPHFAAGPVRSPPVLEPSPRRWPPLCACEPRAPVERLQRSAQPTLGGITAASLPSSLSPLLFLLLRSPLFYHFFATKVVCTSQV